MATNFHQALQRSSGGQSKSILDKRDGSTKRLLHMNNWSIIQVRVTDPADGTVEVGMLPKGFYVKDVLVMIPAGAGTFGLATLLYNGVAATTLRANTSPANAVALLPATVFAADSEVPITLTTAGVTGTLHLGILGVPVDEARSEDQI